MNSSQHITACQLWLKNVVIKYNFCPFARKEFDHQTIEYLVCDQNKSQSVIKFIATACEALNNNPEISTTLVILPRGFERFDCYLDLVDAAQEQIIDSNYEGIYQLASFHPNYCFADADRQDPANYTNRSPAPMIHILREAQLEQAIGEHPDPESIPEKNITLARRKGLAHMQQLLHNCTPNND